MKTKSTTRDVPRGRASGKGRVRPTNTSCLHTFLCCCFPDDKMEESPPPSLLYEIDHSQMSPGDVGSHHHTEALLGHVKVQALEERSLLIDGGLGDGSSLHWSKRNKDKREKKDLIVLAADHLEPDLDHYYPRPPSRFSRGASEGGYFRPSCLRRLQDREGPQDPFSSIRPTFSTFSGRYDADDGKKMGQIEQGEHEFNGDEDKNQQGQTCVSEKNMSEDEKPSQTRVQEKKPSVDSLLWDPSSTPLSFSSCTDSGNKILDSSDLLFLSEQSQDPADTEVLMDIEEPVLAMNQSTTNTLPTPHQLQTIRRNSCPSLSPTAATGNQTRTRSSSSLPDMRLRSSVEEFTPEICDDEDDEDDEGYRFQCSAPGLYQCSVTGLVFHMEGRGDVVYRTVPWDRRLLEQQHKRPAGPLFDIQCLQLSLRQLHLPHCEILSTGGGDFMSVAHVKDEGIEFVSPHHITETHVIIKVTEFSGFGNVKDENSPPDPVRGLVLLFYCPPIEPDPDYDPDPDPESFLNVLMLPRNVVLRKVLRSMNNDEIYIKIPPNCKLVPQQKYKLSEVPEDDLVLVQPAEAEFDSDDYDNYFPSFQVSLEKVVKHIKLILRDSDSCQSVWAGRVPLSSTRVRRSCGQSSLLLPADQRLLKIRSSFIQAVSEPVIKILLDRLLEKEVITDADREKVEKTETRDDKARLVIDTVRRKGEDAGSEMIQLLCELDSFLCQHLGLK